jgi:hypothetical protein
MKKPRNLWLRAFWFNEPQVTANVAMVPALLLALFTRDDWRDIPWWMYVVVALICPAISYFSNVNDPLPDDE